MLPNEVRIGQNADHREIARFLSLQDRNFRPLLRRLEIFKDDIVRKIQSFTSKLAPRETHSLGIVLSQPLDQSERDPAPGQLYECPSLPCDTFYGRENELERIGCHFNEKLDHRSTQSSVAICGFGECCYIMQSLCH